MNNEQILAALAALPDPDMLTATKITDPIGAGSYYRADTVARLLAKEREKHGADTMRMDFLERHEPGRYDEVSGPDVFAVMFRLIEPGQDTLREAVDAAMAADETRNA